MQSGNGDVSRIQKTRSYSSELQHVFQLEEDVSRAIGQNSLIKSLGQTKLLTPQGNNDLIFRLTRDQVVLLETVANLCASRRQANDFYAVFFLIFELGGITKHLMALPVVNSEFCFPSTSMFP